jgi:hypothetical protein
LQTTFIAGTFRPQINKSSSTRSSSSPRSRNSNNGTSFAERLHAYGRRKEEKLDRKRMEARSIRDKEATFKPNIKHSRSRHSMGGRINRYTGDESVEEAAKRLSQVETKAQYEKRLARRRKELAEQEGQTFKPRVNRHRSNSARRSREEDSKSSIWDRLNKESKDLNARQEAWKKQREAREMEQCKIPFLLLLC